MTKTQLHIKNWGITLGFFCGICITRFIVMYEPKLFIPLTWVGSLGLAAHVFFYDCSSDTLKKIEEEERKKENG